MAMMKIHICLALLLTLSSVAYASNDFITCLKKSSKDNDVSSIIHTSTNSSFSAALDFYIQNTKFLSPETPKPAIILTPETESHIQTAISCAKKHGLEMRIRSGGHDFEGNSYVSKLPFFVLDMLNFRSISVDVEARTAWVGGGAMLGEMYYAINEQSKSTLGFPGGYCPTVGVAGFISGGGYGSLTREHGFAGDNVVDAKIIVASGEVLDRESMGEDLFWALRGGCGSSFGVILAYKLKLVDVPEYVTGFTVIKTTEQDAAKLLHKWQHVVPNLPLKLTLSLQVFSTISPATGKPTAMVMFSGLFREPNEKLLPIMDEHFPELGLTKEHCKEMLWMQFFPYHMNQPYENPKEFLTSRVPPFKFSFSGKADFLMEYMPLEGIEKVLAKIATLPPFNAQMEWTHFGGGVMESIPETETPFPHRKAKIMLFENANWAPTDGADVAEDRTRWVGELHEIVGDYVQKSPVRYAYVNYRDYQLGVNNANGETSYEQAKKWGVPYFKGNFDRLVKVKNVVDPGNFFRNEQSFPIISTHSEL